MNYANKTSKKNLSKYLFLGLSLVFLVSCTKKNKIAEFDEPSFMVSTLPVSTQGNIYKNLGYYCRIFSFTDIKNYGAQLDATVKSIIEAGKQQGANGLLGLQFSNINVNNNLNNIENKLTKSKIKNETEQNLISLSIMQVCGDMVIINKN